MENQLAVPELDLRRRVLFDHLQQVAFAPHVMAFAVEVFAGWFALLLCHLLLLLPDPAELGDGKHADGVEVHAERGGDAHFAGGGGKRSDDVLDVLFDYLHRNPAQIDCRDHQYSRCALTMRKMRSTCSSFWSTS